MLENLSFPHPRKRVSWNKNTRNNNEGKNQEIRKKIKENIRVWYLHQENKQIPWQQKLKGNDHQKLKPRFLLMFFVLIFIAQIEQCSKK